MNYKKMIFSCGLAGVFAAGSAFAAGAEHKEKNDQAKAEKSGQAEAEKSAQEQDPRGNQAGQTDQGFPEFTAVDQNEDGHISEEEMRQNEKTAQALKDSKKSFSDLDGNNDQKINYVEFAEFRRATENQMAAQSGQGTGQTPESVGAAGERSETMTDDTSAKDEVSAAIGDMTPSEIGGKDVQNLTGEKIGTIKTLTREKSTGEVKAVIESGGFLGMGDTDFVVPLSELEVEDDHLVWQKNITQDGVEAYGDYDESLFEAVEENNQRIKDILAH